MSNNVSDFALAVNTLDKGASLVETGKGQCIAALVPLVENNQRYFAKCGKGDKAFTHEFTLAEYRNPVYSDGQLVVGAATAKQNAFFESQGIENPSDTLRSNFPPMVDAAVAIANGIGEISKGKKPIISVPLGLTSINLGTVDKPSSTAKVLEQQINFNKKGADVLTGDALFEEMASVPVKATGAKYFAGGKTPTQTQAIKLLGEEAGNRGLVPVKASRNTTRASSVETFRASLSDVTNTMLAINKSDEAPIALTDKDDSKLQELANQIAAYFAS